MHLHFSCIHFIVLFASAPPLPGVLSSFARLSYLKHLFRSLIKQYYSSIIRIVLYLTYFTVPDIVLLLCCPLSTTVPCPSVAMLHDI